MKGNRTLPWRKFETVMIPNSLNPTMPENPVDNIEVFVDDFIGATNNYDLTHFIHLSRCMLHGIHEISPPSEVIQHRGGDLVPEKKLNKENGTWAHEKEYLGWVLNGQDFTLHIPEEKNRKKDLTSFRTSISSQQNHQEKSWINFQAAFSIHHLEYLGGQGYFHLYRLLLREQVSGCASNLT